MSNLKEGLYIMKKQDMLAMFTKRLSAVLASCSYCQKGTGKVHGDGEHANSVAQLQHYGKTGENTQGGGPRACTCLMVQLRSDIDPAQSHGANDWKDIPTKVIRARPKAERVLLRIRENPEYERPAGRPAVVTLLRDLYLWNRKPD